MAHISPAAPPPRTTTSNRTGRRRLGYASKGDQRLLQARIRRILTVSRCELIVLLTVIVNMVVKPVGQNGWFWGMLLVMVLGIAAVLALYVRSAPQVAAPATK